MAEAKKFPSLAVASAATGIALADGLNVSKFAEIYEHALGHPVWTHEIPRYGEAVHRLLAEQFPLMPTREAAQSNWRAAADAMLAAYGAEVDVRPGAGARDASPIDTLREMVGDDKIIVVTT